MPYPTTNNTKQQFTTLITHILKQSNWKLIRQDCTSCQFKNTTNGKIYEVFQWIKNVDGGFVFQGKMDDIGQSFYWGNDEIYMDVLVSTKGYYLREKAVGTLADKVRMNRIRGCTSFSQEQLLNTFTPILEAMLRNNIPSIYPISPQNIVLDSNQNIKLINPLFTHLTQPHHHHTSTHQHPELNSHKKLALIILQSALLLTHQSAYNLVRNFDKFVIAMIGRGYSQRIIGLVLILLNQGLLPVCVRDWMSGQCTNSWFIELKKYLTKISQTTKHPITKTPKHLTSSIYPNNDQTQDSQNQTISKYRSGKRIKINNPEIEDEQEENQTRRRRYRNRNGFNY